MQLKNIPMHLKRIPFVKYTCYGNNFVIVDETLGPILSEVEKSIFAYQATNTCFGIGSDNLLVVQPCRSDILSGINRNRGYWKQLPDSKQADFIFRMFEPDGAEALCCGNGLMCIANYLYLHYYTDVAPIMTEIPFESPSVISIGTKPREDCSWVNLGYPKRIPQEMVDYSTVTSCEDQICFANEIKINFRSHDLGSFTEERSLSLSGYLVFTGEPHLVIFCEDGFSIPELGQTIFASSNLEVIESVKNEKRVNFGSWLVHHIGSYFNKYYHNIFPKGININFVKIANNSSALEYRCFERGINRETLACGTGALAVAYVARYLNIVEAGKIKVLPHRCRWHTPKALIRIEENQDGWLLHGDPLMLFDGTFLHASRQKQRGKLSDFLGEYNYESKKVWNL